MKRDTNIQKAQLFVLGSGMRLTYQFQQIDRLHLEPCVRDLLSKQGNDRFCPK